VVAGLVDGPDPIVGLAVAIIKSFVKHELPPVPDPDYFDDKLATQGPESVFEDARRLG